MPLGGVVSIGESTSETQGWVFFAKPLAARYVVLAAALAAADVDAVAPASGGGVGMTFVCSC